jgi:hypothetical protein
MPKTDFAKYLNPWMFSREKKRLKVEALRTRDGDNCARCRRPMRFDLPSGYDQSAKLEQLAPRGAALDNYRLCHRRCNAPGLDHTAEVTERIRRKAEAELLSKTRRKTKKAA